MSYDLPPSETRNTRVSDPQATRKESMACWRNGRRLYVPKTTATSGFKASLLRLGDTLAREGRSGCGAIYQRWGTTNDDGTEAG